MNERKTMLDHLDAVTAAGEHHRVVLENDRVRVLETIIRPGEQTALHTHIWAAHLYILSWSEFERSDAVGQVIFRSSDFDLERLPDVGTSLWSEPLPPHSFRNVGTQNFHVITTELKTGSPEG